MDHLRRSQGSKSASHPRVLWGRALPSPSLAILLLSMIRVLAKLVPSPPTTTVSLVAQTVKRLPTRQETRVRSLCQKGPLEKGMATQPTPVFLPGKPHGQRSPAGYSPWGLKESDMTEQLIHTPHCKIFSHRIQESFSNPCMLCK